MPRRTCRPYGYNQILLLPSSLREWLSANLDLTPIPTTYGGVTRDTVPSDPRRRVAVLLYAEARAVPASRQIVRKLHEDISFQPRRRIARRVSRPSVTSARTIWTRSGTYSCRRSSRLRKNSVGTAERRWSARVAISAGCSKRPFSKAAASEEARRTLRYVEPLSDARTPLADFFSILLVLSANAPHVAYNAGPAPVREAGIHRRAGFLADQAVARVPAVLVAGAWHGLR